VVGLRSTLSLAYLVLWARPVEKTGDRRAKCCRCNGAPFCTCWLELAPRRASELRLSPHLHRLSGVLLCLIYRPAGRCTYAFRYQIGFGTLSMCKAPRIAQRQMLAVQSGPIRGCDQPTIGQLDCSTAIRRLRRSPFTDIIATSLFWALAVYTGLSRPYGRRQGARSG